MSRSNRRSRLCSKLCVAGLALALSTGMVGCRVHQTQEGKMPDVDVKVKEGQMPKYDVDTAKVDVTKKKVQVEVPEVHVKMPPKNDQKPAPPPPQ
jgi:hypothetical protein